MRMLAFSHVWLKPVRYRETFAETSGKETLTLFAGLGIVRFFRLKLFR